MWVVLHSIHDSGLSELWLPLYGSDVQQIWWGTNIFSGAAPVYSISWEHCTNKSNHNHSSENTWWEAFSTPNQFWPSQKSPAGEILEHAVLLSVKLQDDAAFERNYLQLRPYYTDTRCIVSQLAWVTFQAQVSVSLWHNLAFPLRLYAQTLQGGFHVIDIELRRTHAGIWYLSPHQSIWWLASTSCAYWSTTKFQSSTQT